MMNAAVDPRQSAQVTAALSGAFLSELDFMKQSTLHLPGHVAIIMDGNGRWAERDGLPRAVGHIAGSWAMRNAIAHCATVGVPQLTLYAFSSDNWKRPPAEVDALLDLFAMHFALQGETLARADIRVTVIGRRTRLPFALRSAIGDLEARTARGQGMHLRIAIDYSSRAAIQAAAPSARQARRTRLRHLTMDTNPMPRVDERDATTPSTLLPPVDLLIRTGGERRLSDFLLWECAYAELLFLDVLWPDLIADDLDAAFVYFADRDRRFGAIRSSAPHEQTVNDIPAHRVSA
jgi:undecaprenyl diphosphate synthase